MDVLQPFLPNQLILLSDVAPDLQVVPYELIVLQANSYQVYLISDCISSRKESDKKTALKRAVSEGALLSTYESILFELTVFAN